MSYRVAQHIVPVYTEGDSTAREGRVVQNYANKLAGLVCVGLGLGRIGLGLRWTRKDLDLP